MSKRQRGKTNIGICSCGVPYAAVTELKSDTDGRHMHKCSDRTEAEIMEKLKRKEEERAYFKVKL